MTHSALTNRRSLRGAATPFSFYFKAAGLALALATTVAQAQTAGEPKPASPSTLEFTDVKSGKVKIHAPEGFLENFIAENVFAGTAMGRRAAYMYGNLLAPGPQGTGYRWSRGHDVRRYGHPHSADRPHHQNG